MKEGRAFSDRRHPLSPIRVSHSCLNCNLTEIPFGCVPLLRIQSVGECLLTSRKGALYLSIRIGQYRGRICASTLDKRCLLVVGDRDCSVRLRASAMPARTQMAMLGRIGYCSLQRLLEAKWNNLWCYALCYATGYSQAVIKHRCI
jgi:hypothetical protein